MATATRKPVGTRVVLIAVAIGALVAFYVKGVHPNLFPKNFGIVEPGKVYRSGQLTPAAFRKVVEERGIRTIIDLGSGKDHPEVEKLNAAVARSLGVTRYVADLYGDSTGNPNWYVWALRIARDPANQPVLVHCGAGSERTGCFVALYDQAEHGVAPDAAYERASAFDHDPRRNPKLKRMLDDWGSAVLAADREGHWLPMVEVPPVGGMTGMEPPAGVKALKAAEGSASPPVKP